MVHGRHRPVRPDAPRSTTTGRLAQQVPDGVNKDDEYLEIWNLVFIQYDQKPTETLVPLPKPVSTPAPVWKRLASILQARTTTTTPTPSRRSRTASRACPP